MGVGGAVICLHGNCKPSADELNSWFVLVVITEAAQPEAMDQASPFEGSIRLSMCGCLVTSILLWNVGY